MTSPASYPQPPSVWMSLALGTSIMVCVMTGVYAAWDVSGGWERSEPYHYLDNLKTGGSGSVWGTTWYGGFWQFLYWRGGDDNHFEYYIQYGPWIWQLPLPDPEGCLTLIRWLAGTIGVLAMTAGALAYRRMGAR